MAMRKKRVSNAGFDAVKSSLYYDSLTENSNWHSYSTTSDNIILSDINIAGSPKSPKSPKSPNGTNPLLSDKEKDHMMWDL